MPTWLILKMSWRYVYNGLYKGLQQLKAEGYTVDAVAPQGAIYLTVQFILRGKKTGCWKNIRKAVGYNRLLVK